MVGSIGRVRACAAAALAAGLVAAAGAAPQRELRQRQVLVGVVDRSGAPVAGLGVADFTVREDGLEREVLRVAEAGAPMQVVFLVDTSAAASPAIQMLRTALPAAAGRIFTASPDSTIEVTTFGERPMTPQPATSSLVSVTRAFERLFARLGTGAYLLEAIVERAEALRKREAARAVLIAFVAEDGPEFSNRTHERVGEALRRANASLWIVHLQGRSAPSSPEDRERAVVLTDVAVRSGGHTKAVISTLGIEPAFASLAAALTSMYEVTYARPDALVPPERLDVAVTRRDATIVAPRWTGR